MPASGGRTCTAEKGFRVAGVFDNKQLAASDLSGPRLYVAATRLA